MSDPAPQLSLTLLGPLRAAVGGAPIELRSARLQALLAFLAVEAGRAHPRGALAALLWPDEPDEAARQNLRQALYQLRQLLGPAGGLLAQTRDDVRLDAAGLALDAAAFEEHLRRGRLAEAAALYGGELLAGHAGASDVFAEWLALRRERLHLLALDALGRLAELALAEGDARAAQAYARRQIALEPWRESAHRQLMLALARAGERAAALAQYEACARTLAEELRAEPEPETRALAEQIRSGALAAPPAPPPPASAAPLRDWADAPEPGPFYGRAREADELTRWLADEGCRAVALLGMGGLGKTTLAARAARAVAPHFDAVIWRSLANAPAPADLVEGVLRALAGPGEARVPPGAGAQLDALLGELRRRRVLLVLDNAESVMEGGGRAGAYRAGYEEYGQLLLRAGQSAHRSCVLVTSRERPRELARLEADTPLVRSVALAGLGAEGGGELLGARGVRGEAASTAALVAHYSGNPLALRLVAETIQELFGGDIDAFLGGAAPIFDDIRDVLDQQLARLSPLELDLLRAMALAREPLPEAELWQLGPRGAGRGALLEALRSLQRRSLVELAEGSLLALQHVVAEHLTEQIVARAAEEIAAGAPELLHAHPLLRAGAKEYVRQSQERVVLGPVCERLAATRGAAWLERRCRDMLAALRREGPLRPSFLAGNLLNLLLRAGADMRGLDAAGLCVWQAYLRGADLPEVDLSGSDLTGSAFTDYAGAVTAVAFSPDGELLAAGADTGAISLWRVADRQLVGICEGHAAHVWSLAFGAGGALLLSGSGDGTARLWDVGSGRELLTLAGHEGGVASVAIHPAGALAATGSLDQTARVWDVASGRELLRLAGHNAKVEAVAFSPDGAALATGGHDRAVRLWDLASGREILALAAHASFVKALAFQPGGRLLASGGDDRLLHLWDLGSGRPLAALPGHGAAILTLAWSADGARLASGSDDQTIRVWEADPEAGGAMRAARVLHGHAGTVRSLAVHPRPGSGGELLASGSFDKSVRLWDTRTGRTLAAMRGHSTWIQSLAFAPEGGVERLLAAGSDGRDVRVWDGASGRALRTLRGHASLTEKIALSPDGQLLASAGWDSSVRLWDVRAGRELHALAGHDGLASTAVAGTGPGGRRLVASGGADCAVHLWDSETGRALARWAGHRDRVAALAFQPGGRLLASGSWDRAVGVWDIAAGRPVFFLHGHAEPVECVAFDPGGGLLLSGGWDGDVRLWDVRSGEVVRQLRGHTDGVEMVAFSPDGALAAACGCDRRVCVWDVRDGRLLLELEGHASWVRCVAFSRDGALLASGGDDGVVRIWELAGESAGRCLAAVAVERPYAGMRIGGATGITAAQRLALRALGAVEEG